MVRVTAQTHDEILAAAARRFAVTGFKGTSLQDIAGEVGCSKAAVLYHFANKEAILTELMAPAIAELAALDARLAEAGPESAQLIGLTGFIELALRFRREIALLHGELPELLQQPAFAGIYRSADRLRHALARHSARPADQLAALILLAGIAAACADFTDLPDDELRPALQEIGARTLGLAPDGTR